MATDRLSPAAPATRASPAGHWDAVYGHGDSECSWTEARPLRSARAIRALVERCDAPIVDVGGGSSRLAGDLLAAGYTDVTVLDVSEAALRLAQSRLGAQAARIHWIAADLMTWTPPRRYELWHDRAVLHFFTDDADRRRYAQLVRDSLRPHAHVVIATFAPGGPTACSGLPVRRSSAAEVADLLGDEFTVVEATEEAHRTPARRLQPFSWVVLQRG